MSSGIEFLDASLSIEVSTSIAERMMNAISTTYEKTRKVTCDEDVLWEWTVSGKESTLSNLDARITVYGLNAPEWRCQKSEPQCPPGYCADDLCQTCTEAMAGSTVTHNVITF